MFRLRDWLFYGAIALFVLGIMFAFNGFMVIWDPDVNFLLSMRIAGVLLLASLVVGVLRYMSPESQESPSEEAP